MTREPEEILNQLSHNVIGAAIEVHRVLGPGFLESVYEEALAIELNMRNIPFVRQPPVAVAYKGFSVGEGRLDFLVGDRLIIELQAVDKLLPIHSAQVLSYLKITGCQLGILMNFNDRTLIDGIKRFVHS